MTKKTIALPANALQAYSDAYGAVYDPTIGKQNTKHIDAHRAGLTAVLALPQPAPTCGEIGDLIARLRGWVRPVNADTPIADLLNEAAAALELITTLSEDTTGVQALREEVDFWRRDLGGRLWMSTALLKDAVARADDSVIVSLRARITADLAAYSDAEAGKWHETCDLCGEPVRPGQPTASADDVSGHERCMVDARLGAPDGPDDTAEKLARDVEAARRIMAETAYREFADDEKERQDRLMVLAERQGYRVTFKHSTAPGTLQGPYAIAKHLRSGHETTFTGIKAKSVTEQVEEWFKIPTFDRRPKGAGMPTGGQSL